MTGQLALDLTKFTDPREEGIRRSLDAAERERAQWGTEALAYVRMYANQTSEPWLMEDARLWAYANGLPPPSWGDKAWGGVTRRAKDPVHGFIHWTGEVGYGKVNKSKKDLYLRNSLRTRLEA